MTLEVKFKLNLNRIIEEIANCGDVDIATAITKTSYIARGPQ
jgi:hypothetical protein